MADQQRGDCVRPGLSADRNRNIVSECDYCLQPCVDFAGGEHQQRRFKG
jgi:hypothetical protein